MASPQTHGLISVSLLSVFLVLAAAGLMKLTLWEFTNALLWGVFIDLDHMVSKRYIRDLIPRILKRGGGMPAKNIELISWLHLWPGLILVIVWGVFFNLVFRNSPLYLPFYFPFLFWSVHVIVDRFQKNPTYMPHKSFWWPFSKRTFIPKKGYPVKPPAEFIINSAIWMLIAFILLALLLF